MDNCRDRYFDVQERKHKTILAMSDDELAALDVDRLNDYELSALASRLADQDEDERFIEIMNKILMSDENHPFVDYYDVHEILADHYEAQGDTAAVVRVVRRMIWRDRHYGDEEDAAELQRRLAVAWLNDGQIEKGGKALAEAFKRFPQDGWNFVLLADLAKGHDDDVVQGALVTAASLGHAAGDEALVVHAMAKLEESGSLDAIMATVEKQRKGGRKKKR